jgi:hypothetical protein
MADWRTISWPISLGAPDRPWSIHGLGPGSVDRSRAAGTRELHRRDGRSPPLSTAVSDTGFANPFNKCPEPTTSTPVHSLAEQLRRQLLLINDLRVHGTDYSDDIGHHLLFR